MVFPIVQLPSHGDFSPQKKQKFFPIFFSHSFCFFVDIVFELDVCLPDEEEIP